ncbi:unnamed protein product, partial [Dibothriocephalus latus]
MSSYASYAFYLPPRDVHPLIHTFLLRNMLVLNILYPSCMYASQARSVPPMVQLHAQVSHRVSCLVAAHRLASEGFWGPIAGLHVALAHDKQIIDNLYRADGSYPADPLAVNTYIGQLDCLKRVGDDLQSAEAQLEELHVVGERIVDMLTRS